MVKGTSKGKFPQGRGVSFQRILSPIFKSQMGSASIMVPTPIFKSQIDGLVFKKLSFPYLFNFTYIQCLDVLRF